MTTIYDNSISTSKAYSEVAVGELTYEGIKFDINHGTSGYASEHVEAFHISVYFHGNFLFDMYSFENNSELFNLLNSRYVLPAEDIDDKHKYDNENVAHLILRRAMIGAVNPISFIVELLNASFRSGERKGIKETQLMIRKALGISNGN